MDKTKSKSDHIEAIAYVASLVTNSKEVDAVLDRFRQVTSKVYSSDDLTDQDKATLASVQKDLEDYLVDREKLRFFTRESLRLQVEQHLRGENAYKNSKMQLWTIIVLSIAASWLTLFMPLSN